MGYIMLLTTFGLAILIFLIINLMLLPTNHSILALVAIVAGILSIIALGRQILLIWKELNV